jgi:hypothetical protein
VDAIGALFGSDDDGCRTTPVLGGEVVQENLALLDALEGVVHDGAAILILVVVNAVDEHVEVAACGAAEGDVVVRTVCGDFTRARKQGDHGGEASIKHRQFLHFGGLERGGHLRLSTLDHGSFAADDNLLLNDVECESEVERKRGASGELDAERFRRGEAAAVDHDVVDTKIQRGDAVQTVTVTASVAHNARASIGGIDLRTGDHSACASTIRPLKEAVA